MTLEHSTPFDDPNDFDPNQIEENYDNLLSTGDYEVEGEFESYDEDPYAFLDEIILPLA